jgi:hypothetical protein
MTPVHDPDTYRESVDMVQGASWVFLGADELWAAGIAETPSETRR